MLLSCVAYPLVFPDHVHYLDSRYRPLCCPEGFKPQYRPNHSFHSAMSLLDEVVEILALTDFYGRLVFGILALDRRGVGPALVDRELLGCPLVANRLA